MLRLTVGLTALIATYLGRSLLDELGYRVHHANLIRDPTVDR